MLFPGICTPFLSGFVFIFAFGLITFLLFCQFLEALRFFFLLIFYPEILTVFRFQKNNLVHHFQNPGLTHPLLPIDLCFQSLINLSPQLFISFSFLKRYFSYLLLDQREGRKKGKERNIDQLPFPHAPSGDCTCNPSMYPDHRDLSL